DLAHQQCAGVDERTGDGRREQNPDHSLAPPVFAEAASQEDGLDERREKTDAGDSLIGHGESLWMTACGLDERARQSPHQVLATLKGFHAELLNGPAR